MSVRVMSWVWAHSKAPSTAKFVLLAIADCACDDGGDAWPSLAALASKTNMSKRAVQDCVARLISLGEVERENRVAEGHRQASNRYRVVMTEPVRPRAKRVAISATGEHTEPMADSATSEQAEPVAESAIPPVAISATGAGGRSRHEPVAESAPPIADHGIALKDEPSLNHPVNHPVNPPTPRQGKSPDGDVAAFLAVWENNRGRLHGTTGPPNKTRTERIRRVLGLADLGTLGRAIALCATDSHYLDNGYGIDTFLIHHDRWLGLGATGRKSMAEPIADPKPLKENYFDRRLRENRERRTGIRETVTVMAGGTR